MNNIARLHVKDREELFQETAFMLGTTASIVEKDFWVVWVLDKLFNDDKLSKILMFKGGTSLSKVFNVTGRFSEDIDLILDWREVTKDDPKEDKQTKSKQVKFNEQINENAKVYIKEQLLTQVRALLSPLCFCKIDEKNHFNINIAYPATFKDNYLRNEILLEIGPLASWLPYDGFEISSYAAQKFPKLFTHSICKVNTILAQRTFWEKATILHQEANRSKDKQLPLRYSRHYYDLAMMAKSDIKDKALADLALLRQVVDFKMKFYPASWAKFEEAKPGSFKLLPEMYRVEGLQKDYKSMENMIFDKKLTFEEILTELKTLENEVNSLRNEDK